MAKFYFSNLDAQVRSLMLAEINQDIASDKLYISDRLNDEGKKQYSSFLTHCSEVGDEEMLQNYLDSGDHFNPTYLRQGKAVKMPSNASQLLAQSEFNRFYIRAICLQAIGSDLDEVEIYRARESSWVREGSEEKIGTRVLAMELLNDLRNSVGIEPKMLPEVNSGLSVRI